jgi:hypothetical protein
VTNVAPDVSIGVLASALLEGEPVTLVAGVTDPGFSDSFTYSWSVTGPGGFTASGTEAVLGFTPPDDGDYAVTLSVRDLDMAAGESDVVAAPRVITVGNAAPVPQLAINGGEAVVPEGAVLTFTQTAADPDPGDDAVSLGTLGWTLDRLQPDGSRSPVSLVGASSNTASELVLPAGLDVGSYEVSLTLTDDDAAAPLSGTVSLVFTVTDTPLTGAGINALDGLAGAEGATFDFSASLTGSHPQDTYIYDWQVTSGATVVATQAGEGGAFSSFAFTPVDEGAFGPYQVRLTVTDEEGNATLATALALDISNAPPVIPAGTLTDQTVLEGSRVTLEAPARSLLDVGSADYLGYLWQLYTDANANEAFDTGDTLIAEGTEPGFSFVAPPVNGAGELTYRLQLTVTDDSNASATQGAALTVAAAPAVLLNTPVEAAEGGTGGEYKVRLATRPAVGTQVTVNIVPDGQVQTGVASVIFTEQDGSWNAWQTVTVTAVDDRRVEGLHQGVIRHTVTSTDAAYERIGVGEIEVSITDNDAAGLVLASDPLLGTPLPAVLSVTEAAGAGNQVEFWVKLAAAPAREVQLGLYSTARGEGRLTDAQDKELTTLSFRPDDGDQVAEPGEWNYGQQVRLSGVNDGEDEGAGGAGDLAPYEIRFLPLVSADAAFSRLAADLDPSADGTQSYLLATTADAGIASLKVTDLQVSGSTVAVTFNNAVDLAVVNLYDTLLADDGPGGTDLGPADFELRQGSSTGAIVRGSWLWGADGKTATFAKSGGAIAPGDYFLRLRSAADGIKDEAASGGLLDGNGDGTLGDDYTTTFTVVGPPANADPAARVTVSVPDVARGPGQALTVSYTGPTSVTELPLRLTVPTGTTLTLSSFQARLKLDPALVTILNDATLLPTLGPAMPTTATLGYAPEVSFTKSPAGSEIFVTITYTPGVGQSLPQVTAGTLDLLRLELQVKDTAEYGTKWLLDLYDVKVNGATPIVDDGLQVIAYPGDTDGLPGYDAADVQRIRAYAVSGTLANRGFAAYPNLDPFLVGDLNPSYASALTGATVLTTGDASILLREIAAVTDPAQEQVLIPPLPVPLPSISFADGLDPALGLPRDLLARPGEHFSVPLTVDTLPAGLESLTLQLGFDPAVLTLDGVRAGELIESFGLLLTETPAPGHIRVDTAGVWPIGPAEAGGTLLVFDFRVQEEAPAGATALDLEWARLDGGRYVLIPEPVGGEDGTDGQIVILGPALLAQPASAYSGELFNPAAAQLPALIELPPHLPAANDAAGDAGVAQSVLAAASAAAENGEVEWALTATPLNPPATSGSDSEAESALTAAPLLPPAAPASTASAEPTAGRPTPSAGAAPAILPGATRAYDRLLDVFGRRFDESRRRFGDVLGRITPRIEIPTTVPTAAAITPAISAPPAPLAGEPQELLAESGQAAEEAAAATTTGAETLEELLEALRELDPEALARRGVKLSTAEATPLGSSLPEAGGMSGELRGPLDRARREVARVGLARVVDNVNTDNQLDREAQERLKKKLAEQRRWQAQLLSGVTEQNRAEQEPNGGIAIQFNREGESEILPSASAGIWKKLLRRA